MTSKQLIIACLCGTALEWFDFSLFGALSPILAALFFPHHNESISLLKTFAVFATGFLMRPIGALIWGYLGDKKGRKKTMVQVITIMTISSV